MQATIASKVAHNSYSSLRDLETDIEWTCREISKTTRDNDSSNGINSSRLVNEDPPADAQLLARILAFQRVFKEIARDNEANQESKISTEVQANGANINGVKLEQTSDEVLPAGKSVLSIFANAQGPKQLFSSFQEEVKVGSKNGIDTKAYDESVKITLPIDSSLLPGFITLSTRSHVEVAESPDRRRLKFGKRFGPPAGRSLPPLLVPKPSNKLIIKSGNVNWIPHETLSKSGAARPVYNWPSMKQASGKWLNYSGFSSSKDPKSPESKRRQRDRALSTGAANPPQSDESRVAEEQAREEALFQSAFSSFAPCVDNSGAIVPEHVKNEIWWERVGRQRAQNVFVDPALEDDEDDRKEESDSAEQERLFTEVVENYDPALLPTLEEEQKQEDEVNIKLQEISNLIETLYSYQKIRISQLPSTSVPIAPAGARQPLSEIIGTPETPSAAEQEVYKNLKAQLALAVLDLPPYAVTKLNGDKYADLAVSTSILLETDDDAGIMEDESRAPSKATAIQAPSQTQSSTPRPAAPSYGSHAATGSQYGRTPATAPVAGRGNSTYYPQQSAQSVRTSSNNFPRTTGGATNYGGYPQNAARPSHSQAVGSYTTPSRPAYAQPQYSQQQSQPVASTNRGAYGQYYQSTSQQGGYNRQYQQAAVPNYGQRPQPQQYGYTPQPVASPNVRTASPMQPNAASPAVEYNRNVSAQPRAQYYGPPQASAVGPSGFHSSMTPVEQQMLMDRQRAQVAMQSNSRPSITPTNGPQSYSPQRQMSSTPQPLTNYAQQPQMNGPMGS